MLDAIHLAVLMSQLGYPTQQDEMAARLRRILPCNDYLVAVAVRDELVVGVIAAQIGLHIEISGRYGCVTALSSVRGMVQLFVGAASCRDDRGWKPLPPSLPLG